MGSDKAGLAIDGQSFLERALHVLDAVVTDVRIACGPTPRYLEYGRELVLDRAGDLGPLGGLEAALFSTRAEFVLALACDMPRVDSALLAELVDVAIARDLDVCVLRSTRGIEPLCGVWRVSMAHAIESALARGERRVVAAFDAPLSHGSRPRVGFVDVAEPECVFNVNTPADFQRERSR